MNSFPTVSLIMPAYNAEMFIHDTLDSIITRTFDSFELIVINDGSTDSTENIIKK